MRSYNTTSINLRSDVVMMFGINLLHFVKLKKEMNETVN
jgi:hypothetical protein